MSDAERLPPQLITAEEAADLIMVSPERMMELIEEGKFHFFGPGKDGLFRTGLSMFQAELTESGLLDENDLDI